MAANWSAASLFRCRDALFGYVALWALIFLGGFTILFISTVIVIMSGYKVRFSSHDGVVLLVKHGSKLITQELPIGESSFGVSFCCLLVEEDSFSS